MDYEEKTQLFDQYFSYLVMYHEGKALQFVVNFKFKNDLYKQTLEQLRELDDPSKVILAVGNEFTKTLEAFIQLDNKEAIDKVSFEVYDSHTFMLKCPEFFQNDDED